MIMQRLAYFIALILIFYSCSELLVNEPESDQNMADFDAAWKITEIYYPFFEFKGINWDSLSSTFKPRALRAKGDEIYSILYDLFRELKDGHIEIHTEGGFPVNTYVWPREQDRKAFSPSVVRSYFNKPLRLAGDNKIDYELIDNNIGYVHFSTFTKGDWIQDVDKILDYFKYTKGLIVDIRNNSGGSSITYDYVLTRFIHEPIEETVFFQDGSKKSWWIYPGGDFQYRENVVILINGASFSASEIFTELMKQFPNVVVVGDTSGGGGGAAEIFHLPSGKRLKLPVKYFKRLDGEMIEWNGIIPDIVVEQTETDIEFGRDKQLEYSIRLLRNLNIKSANQKMERTEKAGV